MKIPDSFPIHKSRELPDLVGKNKINYYHVNNVLQNKSLYPMDFKIIDHLEGTQSNFYDLNIQD
ncbi:hypothetical protein Phpb_02746 [Photorhabdus namnaonensis]|uniref:Uncharacterized protein n=1 Tax=Photorhabdus namnaonensis TaxID=1851568 RepID=A0A1B8YGX4_9GAMM|nr:hypothetical protein Phpb_02746 [Photorhabdus namnaonensis]